MHRIDLPEAGIARRFPSHFLPRDVPADWCTAVQEEICHVIESQGIPLQDSQTQLKEAIERIFELGGTPSVVPLDQGIVQAKSEVQHQEIHLPWTPVDSQRICEVRFRLTVLHRIQRLTESIYRASEQNFIFFNGHWIDLPGLGLCYFSSHGHLFWNHPYSYINRRTGQLRPLTAKALIFSHVEKTFV